MQNTINHLQLLIPEITLRISALPDSTLQHRPAPRKWSPKEIIGHLIDSAHSNLRRFIVGQYDIDARIIYEQDLWVQANDYQHMDRNDLITFWRLINERIIAVLENMPADKYANTINTGKTEVSLHSLEWLAADYVKHLQHHINQIFPGTYDVVYG
ncbi:MAG: DinB family protein [Chitinophagales bacterium]